VILRSFLVQAAWNYRTMLGTGMAFALTPALRYLHGDAGEVDRALERHAGHFNAHPYLTPLALGALARLEAEGASPDQVERFRVALRGPLGALGDRLVWAGWLPACALVAIVVAAVAPPAWAVATFLLLFNAGHVAIRVRGFTFGWDAGAAVGGRLRELDLAQRARQLEGAVAFLLGAVVAVWLPVLASDGGAIAAAGGASALLAGYALGPRAWRPTAWVLTVGVGILAAAGLLLSL
jgi:mannose/fructose/N-acetylgalactosamine-specific phosphotransferase system component IID